MREETGLGIVTEIMDKEDLPLFEKYGVDIYQVGARSSQNFRLFSALAEIGKPVLLKRGKSMTLDEFLNAADYIYSGTNGHRNQQVILCERGDNTFESEHRNVLNINNIVYLKAQSHLPVIADPSHAAGRQEYVIPMARAALAAGADGLITEVHCDPANARCDGEQALNKALTHKLMQEMDKP